MEASWLIEFDGKAQYIVPDELTAMRIEAELLKLPERRETQHIKLTKLPYFDHADVGPWDQIYHRINKTMFKDSARRITPRLHSWVRIRPSAYLSEEEIQCNRHGGIWSKVTHTKGEKQPSASITVVGFNREEVIKLFDYEVVLAHETMKKHG